MKLCVQVVDVKVDHAIKKRDGGTYKGCTITYENTNGEIFKKSVAEAALQYRPALKKKISELKAGSEVVLILAKKGDFNNLEDILSPAEAAEMESQPAPANDRPNKRTVVSDSSIGMQVGNALTNAANLIAADKSNDSLENVALDVLRIGEALKKRLVEGDLEPKSAKPKKVSKEAVVQDDDIPFGE